MNHKKSNSKVHVPFSWEKIPGVPKFMASPICAFIPGLSGYNREVQPKLSLPLPPGSFRKPVRSVSKGIFLWKEEDPFLAAMIECTKDCDNLKGKAEMKKSLFGTKVRKQSKFFLFSCKHSFDVEEGHLSTRPSSLASILGCDRDQSFKHRL